MKTNEDLQRKVQQALKWEPLLHAAEIGVIVKHGIVTLTGTVDCYAKKAEAEAAAKKIEGVKAVVENIEVRYNSHGSNTDAKIARQVINAFKWSSAIPHDSVTVTVESGWVTLQGEVAWNHQKEAAKKAVINLIGVKGVINTIAIRSNPDDVINTKDIYKALLRSGSLNCEGMKLEAHGHTLTLTGSIDSWYEKEEAARIAWNAPGVLKVDNQLAVKYSREFD